VSTANSKSTVRRAAELPIGSVIATDIKALFKAYSDYTKPWLSSAGGSATNAEMDEYLAHGAEILRVGTKKARRANVETSGSPMLDRFINRLKENPSPHDLVADDPKSSVAALVPTVPKLTTETDIDYWRVSKLLDESNVTEDQRATGEAPCPSNAPHESHAWGKKSDLKCLGVTADPENLSFGAIVSFINRSTGKVEDWVKMSDTSEYCWRSSSGKTHKHAVVVKGVQTGKFSIIRWGV
jgi:hypothetical protein